MLKCIPPQYLSWPCAEMMSNLPEFLKPLYDGREKDPDERKHSLTLATENVKCNLIMRLLRTSISGRLRHIKLRKGF